MSGIPENPMIDTKTRICLYYVENDINLLFDLEKMAAILDFLPTMSKIFSDNATVSGILKPYNSHQKHE